MCELLYYESHFGSLITQLAPNFSVYFNDNNNLVCSFQLLPPFREGYYAINVPQALVEPLISKPVCGSTYFLVSGTGFFHNGDEQRHDERTYGVANLTLVDSDYTSDYVFGVFFSTATADMYCHLEFAISKCTAPNDPALVDLYSRTQSPIFSSPAFVDNTNFFGLYRSTSNANGYDVVLMDKAFPSNIGDDKRCINPKGNLVIDLGDCVYGNHTGSFILRSRFARLGLSLQVMNGCGRDPTALIFLITNNSSRPVKLRNRLFQYVPLATFNGPICNTSRVLHFSASNRTCDRALQLTSDMCTTYGAITTNCNKLRKPKFDSEKDVNF